MQQISPCPQHSDPQQDVDEEHMFVTSHGVGAQLPLWQKGVVPGHTVPQAPQFCVSFDVRTQAPSQHVRPCCWQSSEHPEASLMPQ
jgi:hypothetical protein